MFSVAVTLVMMVGCMRDAPRDNVFDPQSSLYENSGSISGTITRQYPPHGPVDSVRVELSPQNMIVFSDQAGGFRLGRLKPGDYSLLMSKVLYEPVVESVTVIAGEAADLLVRLNGKPSISSVDLVTKHISHWWPIEDEYILSVTVDVSDIDGELDVDTVFMKVDALGFDTLLTEGSSGQFSTVFFDSDFLPEPFSELQGRNILFQCVDKPGAYSDTLSSQVSRIISSSPVTVSPASQTVVDSLPVFRWSSFEVGYSFTYSVDVFRLDESGIPQFVQGSDELHISTFQWQANTPLPEAFYYWTLSVTDRFGNISVSKEATFIVQ